MAGSAKRGAGRRRTMQQEEAAHRLGAFVSILALYLLFAGLLMALGYGLWPALAGATTACVVAGEVARRVITAGTAPAVTSAGEVTAVGSGLPELLRDVSKLLEAGRSGGGGNSGQEV